MFMRIVAAITVLTLSLTIGSCGHEEPTATLYVVSPHNSDIRTEFGDAFSKWHQDKYKKAVRIEWPDVGGTSTIIKTLSSTYASRDTCGYDVIFGGGSATFEDLAQRGFIVAPTSAIPEAVLKGIPKEINGSPSRGPNDVWMGATASYFGIVYNKNRLNTLKIPTPTTWATLTGPEWHGQLSVADPSKSGSVRTCYEMILQQYGWEKGWPILVKIFANAAAIQNSGSAPAAEVGTGNSAAGIVIDFFGRLEMDKQGPTIVNFTVPTGGSSLDTDPIAMFKGAPNAEIASHFIEFVISEEGQKLWIQKAGTPGGPQNKTLGRMSLRSSLYETQKAYLTDPFNPFTEATPVQVNRTKQNERSVLLGELIKAALVDNHKQLIAARAAVKKAGDKPELLAMFDLLPFTDDELKAVSAQFQPADKSLAEKNQMELRTQWRTMFEKRLAEIQTAASK